MGKMGRAVKMLVRASLLSHRSLETWGTLSWEVEATLYLVEPELS